MENENPNEKDTANSYKSKNQRNSKKNDANTQGLGKIPPQARALEEAVLGALMIDKNAVAVVVDILQSESFYEDKHKLIYKAICLLFEKSQPVDLLTVAEQLKKMGELEAAGGAYYLVELTNRIASAANAEFHARIIAQKFIQRELIRVSTNTINESFEDTTDVFDLLDKAEQGLFSITEKTMSRGVVQMGALMAQAIKQIEEQGGKEDGLTGVPSGFVNLDRITSGWQPSDLIIIAARPGMGKCLGKGTKVILYNGTLRAVENIKVGDMLMGVDSCPRQVLALGRGREQMYWIRQNKAVDYRVNESHILSLKRSRNEGRHQKGEILNISVSDFLPKTIKFKSNCKGYKVPMNFEPQTLEIEPYFFGLNLWNGILQNQLSKGATSTQAQHIPQVYISNSQQNRLELLAGLIDSDGHFQNKGNCFEIVQKNEQLAQQIKFLCDSLGFRTTLKQKKASIKSRNFETIVYRLRFFGDLDKIPVRVAHKKAAPRISKIDWRVTGFRIEKDIVDDFYGFELDQDGLFLLEDGTVSHNTSLTLAIACNAAITFNRPCAFFSLEMSNLQLVNRILSMETQISSEKLRRGKLEEYEWQMLNNQIGRLSNVPIFIDDTPSISVFELRAKCRRLKMQHDIQIIIVDYLQLMTAGGEAGKGGNREQEISQISRSLKALAKELSVPVIALSQLSRAVEVRGGSKRPQLSDLRECITADTKIYLPQANQYKTVAELMQTKADFHVLALDESDFKLKSARCLEIWETGEKEIFELKTQSGYTIRTSLNHPFKTPDGWTQLVDLKVGDFVGVARQLAAEAVESELLDEEIIILAHMIGDGCFVGKQLVHYTSQSEASLEIVSSCAQKLWGIQSRKIADQNSKNCYQLYLPSPYHLTHNKKHPFTLLLEKLGLSKAYSYEKQIPKLIFNSSLRQIALFIQHLWATDGGVRIREKGASKIHYSSSSLQLSQQLQTLLLKFAIQSTLQKTQKADYKPTYLLNITGKENILLFAKYIGVFGEKQAILDNLIKSFETVQSIPNQDIIPKNIWNEIRKNLKEQCISVRSFQQQLGTAYCGSGLYKSNLSRQRLAKIADILENSDLQKIATSDLKWDKITQITQIGREMTYDLHIEQYHNFVANHFIIHNSGAIEQDADIVGFIYRPEYYGIMEDEEGNSLKGIGEVIIAKHRNGALDTVRLKWDGQYAKFSNLDDNFAQDFQAFDNNNYDNGQSLPSKINNPSPPKSSNYSDDVPF